MPVTLLPHQKNLLVEEVFIQASLAISASTEIERLVANFETRNNRELWLHIQSFLNHAAMISKFFKCPQDCTEVTRARTEALMDIFEVEDTSPVLSRNARNNVEHLNDRFDRWLSVNQNQSMVEIVLDDREEYNFLYNPENGEQGDWFVKRAYLVKEGTFLSEGSNEVEEANIRDFCTELWRIRNIALKFLENDNSVTRI